MPWGLASPAFFRTNLHLSFEGKDEALHEAGTKLITRAKKTPQEIAVTVIAGIESGKRVILTDSHGRAITAAKRFARPLYNRAVARGGRALAARSGVPLP